MKYIKSKLSHQLLSTIIIAFSIILISVGIILPNTMLPIYEKNLYNYLKQPLDFLDEDIIDNSISSELVISMFIMMFYLIVITLMN